MRNSLMLILMGLISLLMIQSCKKIIEKELLTEEEFFTLNANSTVITDLGDTINFSTPTDIEILLYATTQASLECTDPEADICKSLLQKIPLFESTYQGYRDKVSTVVDNLHFWCPCKTFDEKWEAYCNWMSLALQKWILTNPIDRFLILDLNGNILFEQTEFPDLVKGDPYYGLIELSTSQLEAIEKAGWVIITIETMIDGIPVVKSMKVNTHMNNNE